jgi:hypothetical protein
MNELERLISRLPRPSPSEELDARLSSIVSRPTHREVDRDPRRKPVFAVALACAAIIGFVLGRHSATIGETKPMQADRSIQVTSKPELGFQVVRLDAEEREAIARFVMPRQSSESLFGTGPLEEKIIALTPEQQQNQN